jgi:phage terminase large subunit-like protein
VTDEIIQTPEEELLALLMQDADWREHNRFYEMYPDEGPFARSRYPKQLEFFRLGHDFQQRCLMGGNGTGKTWGVSAFETVCHLTGEYPSWWQGRRFDHPIDAWMAGDTRETTRDIIQAKMLGEVSKVGPAMLGTGMLPRHLIVGEPKYLPNTNHACDFILVKHKSGDKPSILQFKSYDQGRKAFQGTEKHVISLDEEPPEDVYLECLMRGRTVNGLIILTFTPLSGPTSVVKGFLNWKKENEKGASKALVTCGWEDVPHLDEDWKKQTLAGTPAYLREARARGIPVAGVGKVYPVEESEFVIKPIPLAPHWRRCFGFDAGWHNTAAVWFAYDKDEDVAYIYSEYKRGEQPIDVHAMALMARGAWIPGVGDAAAREGHSHDTVLDLYKARGVKLRLADKAVDAGIQAVMSRLSTGKLKVFSTCQKWLEEYRMYSYDDKQRIVKVDDHLMDATRFGVKSGLQIADYERQQQLYIPEIRFG